MKLQPNFILDTDAYKLTHHLLQKPGLSDVVSYGESRIGSHFPATVFTGAQVICIDSLEGQVITKEKIQEGEHESAAYFGTNKYFNKEMWNHILNKYGGMLPLRIRAVKEGSLVPIDNVLFTLQPLDPMCCALVQHTETLFMHVWYQTTIATNSFFIKRDIIPYFEQTGTPEAVEFMVHNFAFRACSGPEQAARGSMGHLISFRGDDINIGDRALKFYYGTAEDSILKSVLASEHSIALEYGPGDGEREYVLACLAKTPDDKICSCVGDTYNIYHFVDNVITYPDIKEKIMARKAPFVIRQDSGDMFEVTSRNINSLANNFGYTYNSKHYKVLHPSVRILQGDGMNRESINQLYQSIIVNKWSADNLITGSGSGLLVKDFNRDTQKFAIKPSYMVIDGNEMNVKKTPFGQPDKASKAGRLKLHKSGGNFMTVSSATTKPPALYESYADSLETIFEHGEMKRRQTFDEIRQIAKSYL